MPGNNGYGRLGGGTTDGYRATLVGVVGLESGAVDVTLGYGRTCAVVGSGRTKCWGSLGGILVDGIISHPTTPTTTVPLELAHSSLTINYLDGKPGSFFTITGWDYLPNTPTTLAVNGQILTTTLAVTSTGNFIVFLDTAGAEEGLCSHCHRKFKYSNPFYACRGRLLAPSRGGWANI